MMKLASAFSCNNCKIAFIMLLHIMGKPFYEPGYYHRCFWSRIISVLYMKINSIFCANNNISCHSFLIIMKQANNMTHSLFFVFKNNDSRA